MAEANQAPPKKVECPPAGAPAWMATFSDLVTLLLTFFVLLYAMSKQDSAKFESMAGSIRKAFAGNAQKIGETIQLGKSPDDSPKMLESQEPVQPFPIDLVTSEGILDKYEINRSSDEDLIKMKDVIENQGLSDSVIVYQMEEGVKFEIKDKIYFAKGSTEVEDINVEVFKKIINTLKENNWSIFVQGHSDVNEKSNKGDSPMILSALRAQAVSQVLINRGIQSSKITTVFYGDSRAKQGESNAKVEFILRKRDLKTEGKRVNSH